MIVAHSRLILTYASLHYSLVSRRWNRTPCAQAAGVSGKGKKADKITKRLEKCARNTQELSQSKKDSSRDRNQYKLNGKRANSRSTDDMTRQAYPVPTRSISYSPSRTPRRPSPPTTCRGAARRCLHGQTRGKSAALEAARSSSRGSGRAPSGPVASPGSAEPARAARRALRRRRSRAWAVPRRTL